MIFGLAATPVSMLVASPCGSGPPCSRLRLPRPRLWLAKASRFSRDHQGVPIATVDKLVDTGLVVVTDGKRAKFAAESFATEDMGLVIGITTSEFKAIIAESAVTKTGA